MKSAPTDPRVAEALRLSQVLQHYAEGGTIQSRRKRRKEGWLTTLSLGSPGKPGWNFLDRDYRIAPPPCTFPDDLREWIESAPKGSLVREYQYAAADKSGDVYVHKGKPQWVESTGGWACIRNYTRISKVDPIEHPEHSLIELNWKE